MSVCRGDRYEDWPPAPAAAPGPASHHRLKPARFSPPAIATCGCTFDRSGCESLPCYSLALSFETHPAPRSDKSSLRLPRGYRRSKREDYCVSCACRIRNNNRADRECLESPGPLDKPWLSFRQKELAPEVFSSPALHSRWKPLAHYWKTGLAPLCQPNPMQTIQ